MRVGRPPKEPPLTWRAALVSSLSRSVRQTRPILNLASTPYDTQVYYLHTDTYGLCEPDVLPGRERPQERGGAGCGQMK